MVACDGHGSITDDWIDDGWNGDRGYGRIVDDWSAAWECGLVITGLGWRQQDGSMVYGEVLA